MVNYSPFYNVRRRPNYGPEMLYGEYALAPYGWEDRGPLPDIRSVGILPSDFSPRRSRRPQHNRGRNPGLRLDTRDVQTRYLQGEYDDTTDYYACF
jgi:hypothetical protein